MRSSRSEEAAAAPAPAGGEAHGAEHYRRQLETVANNASLALFIMDERQHCTYMNPAAEALTGYQLAEVQGKPLHDCVHHTRPDGTPYPLSECPIDQAFPKNMREQGEEVFVHKDGHFYPVAFTASPVLDQGRPVGTVIEARDISRERREQAERERLLADRARLLRELEVERGRLQQIFVHAPALISVTRGPDHVFDMVNPAYRALLGGRDVVGKPLREALPELEGQGFFEMRDALYASGETHVQKEARVLADLDGDGEMNEYYLNFITQPLRNVGGEIDAVLTFAVDVTDQVLARRLVEEQAAELETQTEELQHQARQLADTQMELEVANDELQRTNRDLRDRTHEAELATAAAEHAADRAHRLLTVASALNEAVTMEQVAQVGVAHGGEALGAHAGSLALLTEGGVEFEILHSEGFAPDVAARRGRFPLTRGRPVSDAVLTGEPILLGRRSDWAESYTAVLADLERDGTVAYAAVPLLAAGRAVGGLSFTFLEERAFDETDRTFLATLAGQVAEALQRARSLEAERAARAEAEAANRAKTEFLSAMSHELRTPLNAIGGYVELLEMGIHGPVTEAQQTALGRIKNAQAVLITLISDILNFARTEAGRIEFRREPIPVSSLMAGLADIVEPQVRAKGLSYRCDPGPAGLCALADVERVQQILMNLLSNAVKFTGPGGRVEMHGEGRRGRVVIRVVDTGRGIPPEKLGAVFEPFVQLDRQFSGESQQGVGLGLAISRELAHGMGGTLTVESVPGEGSTFTLTLPRAPDAA